MVMVIANPSYPTFCLPGDPSSISVYENNVAAPEKLIRTGFAENSLFQEHIAKTPMPRLRIISIHSKSSIKPLQISKDALGALKETYNIGNELWELTSSFGDKPMSAAVGEGALNIQDGENGIQDISYRLTFPALARNNKWTMRQVAVFYHHDPNGLQSLWIFFHVGQGTPLQNELDKYALVSQRELRLDHAWLTLHSSVFSSYLGNWCTYVDSIGQHVDKQTDDAMAFVMRNVDDVLTSRGDINLNAIQNTRSRLLPTSYRLRVILDTLTQLGHLSSALSSQQEGIENGFHKLVACLAYHKNRLDVLIVGVGLLNKKTKDILSMSTLGLNYSMTSQMVSANEQLLHLANKNFDDNATVKVVTFLTLLYLPASLVSSIFGMNLFKFDDGTTEELRISKQFWIFIVATIILAVITTGMWYTWTRKEQITRIKSRLHEIETLQDAEKYAC